MNFIKTLFAVLIANIVLCALVFAALMITGVAMKVAQKPKVEKGSYLVVDIYGEVQEYDPPESILSDVIGDHPETLHRILGNLEKAAVDDRIKGVVMKVSSNNTLGYAMIEEVRGAIARVKEAGKPVYAFSDNMDRKTLFLASACDSIFMPEVGELELVGMGYMEPFIKGTLDKLDIRPNIHRIKDYKSAAEPVMRKDMSPQAKEMMGWIIDDVWDAQLSAISEDRGIPREKIVEDMNYALFLAQEAKDAGFIDGVVYWSDLEDRLKGDDDELKAVSQGRYAKVTRGSVGLDGDDKIAVIHAHGMIGGRKSRVDSGLGVIMGHETVVAQLRAAAEDEKVKAVIFRVDSNGGEALTSDIIGHEVERVAAEKPVIVSMVDVAASGGYSISYRATRLVADATTITGSIGSISGKFNTSGMWNKIGMTFDGVTKGPNSLLFSSQTDFTDAQRKRFEQNHWDGFNLWVKDIARKRGMTFDEVMSIAEGRVWTGRQAKENGLIDEIGGLDRAIEVAKEESDIAEDAKVTIVDYPKKKGLLTLLTEGDEPGEVVGTILFRAIHHELAETLRLLSNGRWAVWEGRFVD
jgi:protease-4